MLTYQVVMFVTPGLTPKERKYLLFLLPGVSLAFVLGIAFGYFVLIPPAFRFLLTFNSGHRRANDTHWQLHKPHSESAVLDGAGL